MDVVRVPRLCGALSQAMHTDKTKEQASHTNLDDVKGVDDSGGHHRGARGREASAPLRQLRLVLRAHDMQAGSKLAVRLRRPHHRAVCVRARVGKKKRVGVFGDARKRVLARAGCCRKRVSNLGQS